MSSGAGPLSQVSFHQTLSQLKGNTALGSPILSRDPSKQSKVIKREDLQKQLRIHYQTFRNSNEIYSPTQHLWVTNKISQKDQNAFFKSQDLSTLELHDVTNNSLFSSLDKGGKSQHKKSKYGIVATKKADLFPQAITVEERKVRYFEHLKDHQYKRTYKSKSQVKTRQQFIPGAN